MTKLNAVLLFGVFFLLDLAYRDIIADVYNHSGFIYIEPPLMKTFLSYFLAVVIIFFVNYKNHSHFSRYILLLVAIFLCFPAILLFKNMNTNPIILFAHILFFATSYLFFKYLPIRIKSKKLKVSQRFSTLLFATTILVIPFFIVYKFNVNLNNILFIDVYETRALHKSMSNTWLAYTYTWLGKIILPMSILFALHLKKHFKTLILSIILIYVFLIGAHKSILIGSIVIIGCYFIPRNYFHTGLILGIFTLLILGQTIYIFNDNHYITGLITRRVFFIPALLDVYYFDFFDGKPLYWSNSFVRQFIEYPYELKPTYLIASEYFNRPDMNANNGIISEGYSNLGFTGVLINILIVSSIFSFFNSLKIHVKFYGIFLFFFFNTVSSGLPTILLTHGGALLIYLSQFLLKDSYELNDH